LQQVSGIAAKHSSYIKEINRPNSETEFRFIFRHNDDELREITLTILAFDVPS